MSTGRRRTLQCAVLAFTITTLLSHSTHADAIDTETLELDVVVNGYSIDEIGEFHEKNGKLYAGANELNNLGFIVPHRDSSTDMLLTALPGVMYRLDDPTQTIFITAANRALKPTLLQTASNPDEQDVHVQSGLGAELNYDIVGTHLDHQTIAEAALDAHAFSPWGLLSGSAIGTAGTTANLPPLLRLNTTYSLANVNSMRQFAAGDLITGGLNWSRPVRMAGIQIASDFGVRPDLVTFPVPTIQGQVAVPSSVDVLVNGVQLLSQNVQSGPFQINQLPVVTGAGSVSVVTRNSAGQQSTQTLPFYASTLLLTPGLSAYSAEFGAVRLNYGLQSNDYQAPATALTYRYGLTNWLTLEGHAEAAKGNIDLGGFRTGSGAMGGAGAAFLIGHFAVASIDGAASHFRGRNGAMISGSAARLSTILSASASVQIADKNFTDIAAVYGQPFPRFQASASLGLALPHLGSLGVAFVEIQQAASHAQEFLPATGVTGFNVDYGLNVPSVLPASRVSLLSASYSREILGGRAYAYGTALEDLSNRNSAAIMVGISFAFGQRGSVEAGFGGGANGDNQTLQATESANDIGDFGWQVIEGTGRQAQDLVSGEYKSPWGLVQAGVDHLGGQNAYRGEVQGAIAAADGHLFAANTIYDSFAVVDTNRTKGVEVMEENRPIAKTGPSGLILVPDLRSFDVNHLSIDPNDIPPDAQVGVLAQTVRPQNHSGVVVHFPIRPSHGALLHLVGRDGNAIPVGSICQLIKPAVGDEVSVGFDGEAYLIGLGPRNTARVTLPDSSNCTADFSYKPVAGQIPEIGPIACRSAA